MAVRTVAAGIATGLGFVCVGISCDRGEDGEQAETTSRSGRAIDPGVLQSWKTVEHPTRRLALDLVTNVVKTHATGCHAKVLRASAERVPWAESWRVRVVVKVPNHTGTATWTVEPGKLVANDDYAFRLRNRCGAPPP
jgi:hypothetical protein